MDATLGFPVAAPMIAPASSAMAVPSLDLSVERSYTIPGTISFASQLAIALLKIGIITDADFGPASGLLIDVFAPLSEKRVVERALSRWWAKHTAPLSLFNWKLHVQCIDDGYHQHQSIVPWFCISVTNGDIPQRTLALRVEKLEKEIPGFGRTVLALLYDAFRYLPEALTPYRVLGMAECFYWYGEADEEHFLEQAMEMNGYATREDLLADTDLFRRKDFFLNMPEWAACATRVLSRTELEQAASSPLGKDVLAVCDAIWSLVTSERFQMNTYDVGVHDMGCDTVSGCVLLRWSDDDACIRVIDDVFNEAYNHGEYNEFISAQPVAPTVKDVRKYLSNMENMLELAALVERLLLLISTPSKG